MIAPEEPLGAAGGGESCGPVCEQDAGETDAWGGDTSSDDAGDALDDADGDDTGGDVGEFDVVDGGAGDAGASDTGASDTGASDTGASDTGASDTGASDTGASDAGASDAGAADAGVPTPDALWDSGVDTGGAVTMVSDAGAADVPDAAASDAYDSSGAPYDGAPSPDSLLNDAFGADAQSSSDGGGQPTKDALDPVPFASPTPADAPAMCEGKPVAPYVQVGRDAPFKVVKHTLPDVEGHKLLVAICSMDLPPPLPKAAIATTLHRRYKPITVHRWASIGVNCKKSTEKETVWDVYDVILAGPPEDRHHVTEFLFNKQYNLSLEGAVHIPELRPKDRERMVKYLSKCHLPLLATLRINALDAFYPTTFEHEMNHVQINYDYLKARERIVNDPRYPATITTPVGTPAEVVREMVLEAVKKDGVERLNKALAEMEACNKAYHAIVKEPTSYEATLKRCVCGPPGGSFKGSARDYVETACMDLASSVGPKPRKSRYQCKYSD